MCKDLELDLVRCAARVGQDMVETRCGKYLDDFIECVYRKKSVSDLIYDR